MKRGRSIAGPMPTASRLVTVFALLALFLQSFAIQTHIHRLAPPAPAGIEHNSIQTPAQAPLKSQDPLDQSGCRLCQEINHSGVFLASAAATLLPAPAVAAVPFFILSLAAAATAPPHAWQSRAPPRR